MKRTGVYILIGEDPDQLGETLAYFGEGDDISTRLRLHAGSEDKGGNGFWNRALVLTSKDANLTKAHVRYLESRFIALATTARRTKLANVSAPPLPVLPEADVSDMESFIEQAQNVLPILGVNFLRSMAAITEGIAQRPGQPAISPTFQMHVRKHNITATAREVDGDFTVLADSTALATWVAGSKSGYKALHTKLVADGSIETSGSEIATFTRYLHLRRCLLVSVCGWRCRHRARVQRAHHMAGAGHWGDLRTVAKSRGRRLRRRGIR